MKQHHGQSLTEIALILGLVAVVVIVSISFFGDGIRTALFGASAGLEGEGGVDLSVPTDLSTFNDLSNWQDPANEWALQDGKLVKSGKDEATILARANGTDYVVNVSDIQLQKGSNYGLLFRASTTTPASGYMLHVTQSSSGNATVSIQRWENGRNKGTIAKGNIKKADLSSANLKLMVQGNTFTAYVNNQKTVVGKDDTYASGTVGMYAPKNVQMSVGNVIVTQGS